MAPKRKRARTAPDGSAAGEHGGAAPAPTAEEFQAIVARMLADYPATTVLRWVSETARRLIDASARKAGALLGLEATVVRAIYHSPKAAQML